MTSSRTNAATRSRNATSCGSRLKSMSALQILEDRSRALSAADAHRDQTVARAAAAHLAEELHGELRAGRAERMAERDRPAVHVHLRLVETELAHDRKRLSGECLVELDQVDVGEREAGALESLRHRDDRTHAHD